MCNVQDPCQECSLSHSTTFNQVKLLDALSMSDQRKDVINSHTRAQRCSSVRLMKSFTMFIFVMKTKDFPSSLHLFIESSCHRMDKMINFTTSKFLAFFTLNLSLFQALVTAQCMQHSSSERT